MKKLETLKMYFGYETLREGQSEVVDTILSKKDVMCVMPTGAGKSLCFQLPALMLDGVTIVISPLISLMKDQVHNLNEMGINAAYINSSLSGFDYEIVIDNVLKNKYKIIYVAPERLESESFLALVKNINISLIAIDEAHCVSQWGQDFRPSYLKIIDFIDELPVRPTVAAFTATATNKVKNDIIARLKLAAPFSITTGFDRPNLQFVVEHPENRDIRLLEILKMYKDYSGIVYCSTRKTVEKVNDFLQRNGFLSERYHAGLDNELRKKNQDKFIFDNIKIIVATTAFGMGIDKSNVKYVIHYNMPKNLESYYQEAGRAGRDGSKADCILLYSKKDIYTNEMLIRSNKNEELSDIEKAQIRFKDYALLEEMIKYCNISTCLRKFILNYFGETFIGNCNYCSSCLSDMASKEKNNLDVTDSAKKIILCIQETNERFGVTKIVNILTGNATENYFAFAYKKSFGALASQSTSEIKYVINELIQEGYINRSCGEYPILSLTEKSSQVLINNGKVFIADNSKKNSQQQNRNSFTPSNNDSPLFIQLKELRANLAKSYRIPAESIFKDYTLELMANNMPQNKEEMKRISGVGTIKLNRYGDTFLSVITNQKSESSSDKYTAYRKKLQESGKTSAYEPWSESEENRLIQEYLNGATIIELSELHKRSYGAIQARLKKCNMIE